MAYRRRTKTEKGTSVITSKRREGGGRARSAVARDRLVCVAIAIAAVAAPGLTSPAAATGAPTRMLEVALEGSGVVRSTDGRIDCGPRCRARYRTGSVATLTARAQRYFSFAEWNKGCIGLATTCTVAFDSTKSVQARFTRDAGRVNVTVGGRGAVVSEPSGISCATAYTGRCVASPGQGTTVTLIAAPAPGAVFAAWGGACRHATSATCELVAGAADEVTATFRAAVPAAGEQVLTVQVPSGKVASVPAAIACPLVCSAPFASGTAVTLRSLHASTAWGGACAGDSPACVVSVDEPTNVVAAYYPISMAPAVGFGITVTVTGPGRIVAGKQISCSRLGTKRSCESFFRPRSRVMLRAIPNRNGKFARWDRRVCARPRAMTCTVRALSSRTISAAFVRR